jgi:two-component system chemotaxis response regulator CheB
VHDAGGITVVQAPETAQSPLMVLSALRLRPPDLVLPLDEIAVLLRTLRAHAVRG